MNDIVRRAAALAQPVLCRNDPGRVARGGGHKKKAHPRVCLDRLEPDRIYLATGMVNSAPLAMLSGQRCITLL
jgi:hypothetical protein